MGRGPSSKVVHETSGAVTIRMLRERARLSQGEVEVEAELGENYLNRIERGLIARPKRVTLERILDALQATYDDRRHVLESYGYVVTNPLPSTTEIVSAQVAFNQIAVDLMVPAQLLDCAQRMQASNRLLELTIGHAPGSTASRRLVGRSIFEITFDPQHRVRQRILNLSTWGRHMLPVLMYELRTYGNEPWCQELLAEVARASASALPLTDGLPKGRRVPARPLVPIVFQGPDSLPLSFYVATEVFVDDSRFRMVYYLPADEMTHHVVSRWVTELQDPKLHRHPIENS